MDANATTRDVTALIDAWRGGDRTALDRLLPEIYADLRRIAHRELARERANHTLDTGALIHEAYLKLVGQADLRWQSRAHLFAIVTRAMRTVLIDYARARQTAKRGSGTLVVPLDEARDAAEAERVEHLLALDDALTRLAEVNEEASRIVEYRYFAGLTLEEASSVLEISLATTRRRWQFAKAWLSRELREPDGA